MSKILITATKDAFALSIEGNQIMKVHVLEQQFEPKKQVSVNIAKAQNIRSMLEAGKFQIAAVQNRFNSLLK